MKIVAVICNVVFWGFFCMVMLTDGPPKGADILLSLIPFLMPIFNVLVIRVLSSPSRVVKLVALGRQYRMAWTRLLANHGQVSFSSQGRGID